LAADNQQLLTQSDILKQQIVEDSSAETN